jgi:PIN domain nuclease of toxin-antitoxin system
LDASALLAFLHGEPGGADVEHRLEGAVISAVNWSEVLHKSLARGVETEGLREDLEALGTSIDPFTVEDAEAAARLWLTTRSAGLSIGDRACLALALRLGLPALTADRSWKDLTVGVGIKRVR